MTGLAALRAAVEELIAVQTTFASVRDAGTDWRTLHLERRRAVQAQIGRVATLIDGAGFADPEEMRAFRQAFARMRSAVAGLQATWPVVSIDRTSAEYRRDVALVRQSNAAFAHEALAILDRQS